MTPEERIAALEARVAALEGAEPAFLKDCRTDYFPEGLHGGGVRITHLPTGLSAEGHAGSGLADLARELAGDLARMLAEHGDLTDAEAQAAAYVPPPAAPAPPKAYTALSPAQVKAVTQQVEAALLRQARANSTAARTRTGIPGATR
jgi:hypothetical protein